jgi:hypothetical protein
MVTSAAKKYKTLHACSVFMGDDNKVKKSKEGLKTVGMCTDK